MSRLNIKDDGVATQFPKNRPYAPNAGHKGPYLIPLLRKFLEKKISFEDPETQKIIKGKVKDAIMWRLLLNAAQGDNVAIKEVLDRLDGRAIQKIIGEGFNSDTKIVIVYPQGWKPKEERIEQQQSRILQDVAKEEPKFL